MASDPLRSGFPWRVPLFLPLLLLLPGRFGLGAEPRRLLAPVAAGGIKAAAAAGISGLRAASAVRQGKKSGFALVRGRSDLWVFCASRLAAAGCWGVFGFFWLFSGGCCAEFRARSEPRSVERTEEGSETSVG